MEKHYLNEIYETYTIVLTYHTYFESHYIEKGVGLKNREKITREDFDEIQHMLRDNFTGTKNIRDHQIQFEKGVAEVYNIRYIYSVTKKSIQDRYLIKTYGRILEDTYIGTITHYLDNKTVINSRYKDNNEVGNEIIVTYE